MRLTTWTLNKGWRQWLGFFIFFYACLLALPASATISPGTIDFGAWHGMALVLMYSTITKV